MSHYTTLTQNILEAQDLVTSLEGSLSAAKRELRIAEQDLIDAMAEGLVPEKFEANGYTWGHTARTLVTPIKDHADYVVSWIKENGGENLVKHTMHAASRDKFLRDIILDETTGIADIPEELADHIQTVELNQVTKRKGK